MALTDTFTSGEYTIPWTKAFPPSNPGSFLKAAGHLSTSRKRLVSTILFMRAAVAHAF
jgi:hypothetical protein